MKLNPYIISAARIQTANVLVMVQLNLVSTKKPQLVIILTSLPEILGAL